MGDHRTLIGACIYLMSSSRLGKRSWVNSAADLGVMFIVSDVNVCASVQIIDMGGEGPWETNLISII